MATRKERSDQMKNIGKKEIKINFKKIELTKETKVWS